MRVIRLVRIVKLYKAGWSQLQVLDTLLSLCYLQAIGNWEISWDLHGLYCPCTPELPWTSNDTNVLLRLHHLLQKSALSVCSLVDGRAYSYAPPQPTTYFVWIPQGPELVLWIILNILHVAQNHRLFDMLRRLLMRDLVANPKRLLISKEAQSPSPRLADGLHALWLNQRIRQKAVVRCCLYFAGQAMRPS